MGYFARNLWRRLWYAISQELSETCDLSEDCNPKGRLAALDISGTGFVAVEEIQMALHDYLGFSVDDREISLAEFVHSFADTTCDGKVALRDFELFCEEMREDYENDEKWRPSYNGSDHPYRNHKDHSHRNPTGSTGRCPNDNSCRLREIIFKFVYIHVFEPETSIVSVAHSRGSTCTWPFV
jgi:hypothetical protein